MGVISIAVPFDDRWFFAELLRGATERAQAAGHRARVHVIEPSPTSTAEAAQAIERDFADPESLGAVAAGFKYRTGQAVGESARAIRARHPTVVIGGSVLGYPTVMIDDIGAARLAVEHLIGLGHRRIAHLAGTQADQMDFLVNSRRMKGYRAAMESAGLEPLVGETEFDPDAVSLAARALLHGPDRPTAVFAVSDEIAFVVLAVARELGLRPGVDLSVVGIDDHARAEAEGLTTVRQRPAEMGAAAVDLVLDGQASGADPKQSRLHPIALIKRESTGRLRSS